MREERQSGAGRAPGPNETPYANTRRQEAKDSVKVVISQQLLLFVNGVHFGFHGADLLLFYFLAQRSRVAAFHGAESDLSSNLWINMRCVDL